MIIDLTVFAGRMNGFRLAEPILALTMIDLSICLCDSLSSSYLLAFSRFVAPKDLQQ